MQISLRVFSIGLSAALVLVAGCSKKDGDKASGAATASAGGSAAATGGGAAAPAAAGGAVKLPKLGLALDAPGEVSVEDAIGGEGHMLMGAGVGALNVTAEADTPALDAEKEDAKMYTPTNLKDETLPDGWALTFENKGSMGTNYWVTVRRTIDGKHYKCGTTGADPKQAAAVLAACKSLRKG